MHRDPVRDKVGRGGGLDTRSLLRRSRYSTTEWPLDEPAVRELALRILSGYGYRVLEASEPTSVLGMLRRHKVDLLITDVLMPGADGIEYQSEFFRCHSFGSSICVRVSLSEPERSPRRSSAT